MRVDGCTDNMTKHPTPVFAGPATAPSHQPADEQRVRDRRRSAPAFDGSLGSLTHAGSAERRRAASERDPVDIRNRS